MSKSVERHKSLQQVDATPKDFSFCNQHMKFMAQEVRCTLPIGHHEREHYYTQKVGEGSFMVQWSDDVAED